MVVLVETTPAAQVRLAAHGWDDRFPYAVGDPRERRQQHRGLLPVPAQPGHPAGPVQLQPVERRASRSPTSAWCGCSPSTRATRTAAAAAGTSSTRWFAPPWSHHGSGPLVVAGDFNAVAEQGPMQRLHRLGLRSATDLAGAGWLPTYPAGGLPAAAAADRPRAGQRPADGDGRDGVDRPGNRPPRSAGDASPAPDEGRARPSGQPALTVASGSGIRSDDGDGGSGSHVHRQAEDVRPVVVAGRVEEPAGGADDR